MADGSRTADRRLRADSLGPWVVTGIVVWLGVAWIGWMLWQNSPPKAGFDLALLLEGARRVLAGETPYDPAMLAGASPDAVELFYSYPPPVAQAMTLLSWLPNGVVLVLWGVGATLGFAWVAARLAVGAGYPPLPMAVRAIAVAPLVLPFAIAVLFGNLDAWYPLAYGAFLLAALPGSTRRSAARAPASPSRSSRSPSSTRRRCSCGSRCGPGASAAVPRPACSSRPSSPGSAIVAVSLLVGGIQPWLDYVQVVRAGAGADLVDARNIGPVSLIGQATGLDGAALRWIQVAVVAAAVVATVFAAVRVRDPILSVGIAVTASLVVLPVTWYHYPVALMPVAAALAIRDPRSRPWIALAIVLVDVGIVALPLVWVGVAVVLFAAWMASRQADVADPR